MKKPIVIANWKSNPPTLKEAVSLAKKVEHGISKYRGVDVAIAPPHIFIYEVGRVLKRAHLGAQNCFFKGGPYTGEVSPEELKNLGVGYVIVGHSERRKNLGETDDLINKKIHALLKVKISPVLCVGEEERTGNEIPEVVSDQLKNALRGVKSGSLKSIIVAYEPVWSISTNPNARPDSPEGAFGAMLYLRRVLSELFGTAAAKTARIIYGGSVNSFNVAPFLQEGKMEGALVGGASLNPDEFIKIVAVSSWAK